MMKKLVYIICFLFVSIVAAGETFTITERVTFGEVELQPGGDMVKIPVNLETAYKYTAVTMDIVLPEGLEFAPTTDKRGNKIYAETGGACDDHVVMYNVREDGSLGVVVMSNNSYTFWDDDTEVFKFYVKAKTLAKPGFADIKVKECFYNDPDGNEYDVDELKAYSVNDKVSVSTSAKVSLNISAANKWSTLVLPFNASLPEGVKAYTCSDKDLSESVLILTPAASLMAFTPYILYSENGYEGDLSGDVPVENYPASGVVSAGLLRGAVTQQVAVSGEYVLANKGVTQFYRVENTKTIPAGKCWVTLPGGMSAKENLGFQIATGIERVTKEKTAGTIHAIDGKKISAPLPNQIFVESGKKIIRRR